MNTDTQPTAAELAGLSLMAAVDHLKQARSEAQPDTGRAYSIAITETETALLWLASALRAERENTAYEPRP